MGANTHDSAAFSTFGAELSSFEEEIDTTPGPVHAAIAAAQSALTVGPPLEPIEQVVEFDDVVSTPHSRRHGPPA